MKRKCVLVPLLFFAPCFATITRTAKGTNTSKTSSNSLAVNTVAITGGCSIIIGWAGDTGGSAHAATWGATTLVKNQDTVNSGTVETIMFSAHNVTGGTNNATVSWTTNITAKAMFVIEVCGLATSGAKDINTGNVGTDATPLDTATMTSFGIEIFVGALGTEGPSGDAAGSWQNGWSAGQRAGTTGNPAAGNITVQEGFKIVSITEASQASLTGITSRSWAITHVTYKDATQPNPLPRNPLTF